MSEGQVFTVCAELETGYRVCDEVRMLMNSVVVNLLKI